MSATPLQMAGMEEGRGSWRLSRRRMDYGRRGEIHSGRLHSARLTACWRKDTWYFVSVKAACVPFRATMVRSPHGKEWEGNSRGELVSGSSWRDDKQRERRERMESPSIYRRVEARGKSERGVERDRGGRIPEKAAAVRTKLQEGKQGSLQSMRQAQERARRSEEVDFAMRKVEKVPG